MSFALLRLHHSLSIQLATKHYNNINKMIVLFMPTVGLNLKRMLALLLHMLLVQIELPEHVRIKKDLCD